MLLRYVAKSSFRALFLCRTHATATTTAAMDLFTFYHPSSVLICKPCGYAVPPTTLCTHIKLHHLHDARYAATNPSGFLRNAANLLATYLCQQYQLLDPATAQIPNPPATNPPIPDLTVYPGYQCTRCSFVLRSAGKEAVRG